KLEPEDLTRDWGLGAGPFFSSLLLPSLSPPFPAFGIFTSLMQRSKEGAHDDDEVCPSLCLSITLLCRLTPLLQAEPLVSHRAPSRLRYSKSRKPPPPKTTLAAVMMLIGGIALSIGGLVLQREGEKDRGRGLLILGIIRSYASWTFYAAYIGLRGYRYSDVPSYDD
ncbi:unnamed protein product, partial [Chrysoparadoxa australica]